MKKVFKKNQIVITTLALMIAVAGYLNYSGEVFGVTDEAVETVNDLSEMELLDISEEDITATSTIASLDNDLTEETINDDGTPGESVLTSAQAIETIASAKVSREQVRAESKATLEELINNEQLTADQKESAVNALIEITERAEMEVTIETLLEAKGFSDVVVTVTEDAVDVIVIEENLTDAYRAQIEDIVLRKVDVNPENIVISQVQTIN